MHDGLYENQENLGVPLLFALAEALGLPEAGLREALMSGEYAPKVRSDFLGGVRSGVNGTPTFFINGRRHDGTWAYFLFIWEDPTRSLKHFPLLKESGGWRILNNGLESGDESDFHEDKFSVLLTTADLTLAGDRTFHASPHPIPGAPATTTGRGLHYSTAGYVDVWEWRATSGSTGWMDDAHFGPPLEPTPMQAHHIVPYKGGFAPDPGAANYADNFAIEADTAGGARLVAPLRLPKDLAAMAAAIWVSMELRPPTSTTRMLCTVAAWSATAA